MIMNLPNLLSFLDKEMPINLLLIIFMVYLFFGFRGMSKDISYIQKSLDNHISDTNKKIEKLGDQFNRLYEILLSKKNSTNK